MERQLKMRILIAKPGLGGHDRRAKQIAQGLKEQGFEVVFTGLRQTAALSHQVDAVGLSLPDSAQAAPVAQVKALLPMDVVLFGFGSLREEEIPALLGAGLEAVFPAGSSVDDMADYLRRRWVLTGTY